LAKLTILKGPKSLQVVKRTKLFCLI